MANEIERKFIVEQKHHHLFIDRCHDSYLEQMYLQSNPTVRVTYEEHRGKEVGWIAVKGASREGGLVRSEWEYEIPATAARAMIAEFSTAPIIKKVRHEIDVNGDIWEVDVLYLFDKEPRHLVVAEIEKPSLDEARNVKLPYWVGREVTGDYRFSMVTIAQPGGLIVATNLAYGVPNVRTNFLR